jgi:Subtilase family
VALHPHLLDPNAPASQNFTSPKSGPHDRMSLPVRDRAAHAEHLRAQVETVAATSAEKVAEQKAQGIDTGNGIVLTFESEPNFQLKFDSLAVVQSGIELLSVKTLPDGRSQASVFVPDGKIDVFLRKIEAYRDEDTTPRSPNSPARPKNQELVESISDIKLAALEALWTDDEIPFPAGQGAITWEVWLRRSEEIDHLARLRATGPALGLTVGDQTISFVDRTIVLVRATPAQLSRSIEILAAIAELRAAKTSVSFFTGMNAAEQEAWVADLAGRLVLPPQGSPYVSLLDTGVNRAHPLVSPVLAENDLHTYRPDWGVDDRGGHGTPMAGLATFGDLLPLMETTGPVQLYHRLESVKLFNEADPHREELYGAVTQESVYRVEVAPDRRRVFCMAVSTPDGRDRGRPSSWSAAVDALASGVADDTRRLIVLSAGNTDPAARRDYPDSNSTDSVHDPAQAWNALTVGGYTDKYQIDGTKYPGWSPLAPRGDLAPCSCTSATWTNTKWPVKPDIVMEAGNMAENPEFDDPDYIDDGLQLLTTAHNFTRQKPLTSFGDTSAAAALAAQMAARVWSKYPDFTPETIRALMIHSAEWTPAMLARFTGAQGEVNYEALLRTYGYGVPNLGRLLSSADNALTLIAQSEIQPFYKDDGRIKTREMLTHNLPWPRDVLQGLGNTPVTMRATLSYFVEPSPGKRGLTPRYGYQSHGLRFAVKLALETTPQFESRINKYARDEEYEGGGPQDTGRWMFGYGGRSFTSVGSVHSDTWTGTAADLAARGHIAIFPTLGWWSKRPNLSGWKKRARYSLVVSISTPSEAVDIYTPVANQIGVPVVVET